MSITCVPNMLKYKVKSPIMLELQLWCCAAANIYKECQRIQEKGIAKEISLLSAFQAVNKVQIEGGIWKLYS